MKKTNIKRIMLTLLAALLAMTMCFAFVGCSDKEDAKTADGNQIEEPDPNDTGYLDVLDNYLTCWYSTFDYEDCLDCFYPAQHEEVSFIEYTLEDNEEACEDYDIEVTWDMDTVEADSIDNIDDIKDSYKENYDVVVTDGKEVSIEVTTIEDGEESTDEYTYAFVKIDGNWYVCKW